MSAAKAVLNLGKCAALGVVLAACAGAGAGGQLGPGGGEGGRVRALLSADALVFTSFDANHDSIVSLAEVERGLAEEWARADANQDGAMAPLEFARWSEAALGGAAMTPYRLDFDRNVDNTITEQEFRAEFLARARDYDHDGDGNVTRAEMVREVSRPRVLGDQASPFGDRPPGDEDRRQQPR